MGEGVDFSVHVPPLPRSLHINVRFVRENILRSRSTGTSNALPSSEGGMKGQFALHCCRVCRSKTE
jgi:hypothetical protein